MFTEEIKEIQSVFDLIQIEKDCEFLRKEKADNGVYLCSLSFVKIEKTSYGKETLKFEFRESDGKVVVKSFVLENSGVEEAIKFMYSFGVVSEVTYKTITEGLHTFEQIAKLFKYKLAVVEYDVHVLGREVKC
jgi:hypothetical protein